MIKVMWICNTYTVDVAKKKNIPVPKAGGWLTGLSEALKNNDSVSIIYCYPKIGDQEQDEFEIDGIKYYSFYSPKLYGVLNIESDKDVPLKRKQISDIIGKEKPDILHIFGTEYVHSLIAVQEAKKRRIKTVCSIQGLISVYQDRYLDYIPYHLWHKANISSIFRKTLYGQMKKMSQRSYNEIAALKLCDNVIGRTDWDRVHTYFINKGRTYYFCNETLRDEFYQSEWDYSRCQKHSIFVSQGSSPIKGICNVIQAIALIKDEFEDIKLYIAGNDFVSNSTLMSKLKRSTYADYILSLIKKYHLENKIHFTGALDAQGMVEQYLSCNVFISPSTIENSSNSIGEAMILGVPVIASNVGGTYSMFDSPTEGLLYEGKDICFLADKIRLVFIENDKTVAMAKCGRKRALKTFDKAVNRDRFIEIYSQIYKHS